MTPPAGSGDAFPSVAFYCHDSYGLGHLRRAALLGRHLAARWPAMVQLLVGSSPMMPGLAPGPRGDYVKLPSVTRVPSDTGGHGYVPRVLPVGPDELIAMRRDILLDVFRRFHPDLLIVDYVPAGLAGELVPSLHHLKEASPATRLVVGLRDILGDPARVRHAWARDGVYPLLERLYDLILVYGEPDVCDLARETGLGPAAAAKVRYTGYLGRDAPSPRPEELRGQLGLETGRLVLVTAGGGVDGLALLEPVLEARRRWPADARFDCLLVGGPLMPAADRERLRALVPAGTATRFVDAVEDLAGYVAAADVVVSRGGYNTVCEILSARRPAIVVPRESFGPVEDREQLLRAEALSRRGLLQMIRQPDLTPRGLLRAVNGLLDAGPSAGTSVTLDGLQVVAAALDDLLAGRGPVTGAGAP